MADSALFVHCLRHDLLQFVEGSQIIRKSKEKTPTFVKGCPIQGRSGGMALSDEILT